MAKTVSGKRFWQCDKCFEVFDKEGKHYCSKTPKLSLHPLYCSCSCPNLVESLNYRFGNKYFCSQFCLEKYIIQIIRDDIGESLEQKDWLFCRDRVLHRIQRFICGHVKVRRDGFRKHKIEIKE